MYNRQISSFSICHIQLHWYKMPNMKPQVTGSVKIDKHTMNAVEKLWSTKTCSVPDTNNGKFLVPFYLQNQPFFLWLCLLAKHRKLIFGHLADILYVAINACIIHLISLLKIQNISFNINNLATIHKKSQFHPGISMKWKSTILMILQARQSRNCWPHSHLNHYRLRQPRQQL